MATLPAAVVSKNNLKHRLGERSRKAIREAALQLMAKVGYAGTSISAIAKASGLPASSLYWHFGSKKGLLSSVAEDSAARWFGFIPSWKELRGPTPERLDAMLRAIFRELERQPEPVRLILMLYLELGQSDPKAVGIIRRMRKSVLAKLRPAIEALLEHDESPRKQMRIDDLCNFTLSYCNGCFIDHQIDPGGTNFSIRRDQLLASLLAITRNGSA
jgi:AcrR family transcriptional regulator